MAGKIFKIRFKESSILSVAHNETTSEQFSESRSVRIIIFVYFEISRDGGRRRTTRTHFLKYTDISQASSRKMGK